MKEEERREKRLPSRHRKRQRTGPFGAAVGHFVTALRSASGDTCDTLRDAAIDTMLTILHSGLFTQELLNLSYTQRATLLLPRVAPPQPIATSGVNNDAVSSEDARLLTALCQSIEEAPREILSRMDFAFPRTCPGTISPT